MKTIKELIALLAVFLTAVSCEKDGDKIILSGLEPSELIATTDNIVLSQEESETLVLSLAWNNSELYTNQEGMGTSSSLPSTTLQVSANAAFTLPAETSVNSESHSFTGNELNSLAKNAGLEAGSASPLYFRIKARIGANMDPVYSNIVTVNVTPYLIDMSLIKILDKNRESTLATLYSLQSDGEYAGFINATAWMNFYLQEGDGNYWGNVGVDGMAFLLTDDESMWNCWYPGFTGCYYTTVSTSAKEWTATYIPVLNLSGDVTAEMQYKNSTNTWSATFTTTSANAAVSISGTGKKYDADSQTDDAAATDVPIAFDFEGNNAVLATTAGRITVPTAGTWTLTLNFNDPKAWVCTLREGEGEEEEVPVEEYPYLYLSGIDDGVSGAWTFDTKIARGSDGIYRGVVYANSLWGFKIYTTIDDWSNYYSFGDSDGTLVKEGENNIPAPGEGVYFITVDLENLTYTIKPLGDEIYISGLNGVWDFSVTLPRSGNGIYSGTINVTAVSEWGFKLYIEADNWDDTFGGSEGILYYNGDGITDDQQGTGTYMLTVDLINATYEMIKQ